VVDSQRKKMTTIAIDGDAQRNGLNNELKILNTQTIPTLDKSVADLRVSLASSGAAGPAVTALLARAENDLAAAKARQKLLTDSLAADAVRNPLVITSPRQRTLIADGEFQTLNSEIVRLQTAIRNEVNTQGGASGANRVEIIASVRRQNAAQAELDRIKPRFDMIVAALKKFDATQPAPTPVQLPPVVISQSADDSALDVADVFTLPGDPSLPGRQTRPAGERPRQQDPHIVVRAATCNEPERRVYFSETRSCYLPFTSFEEETACPVGWRLVGEVAGEHGCAAVGAFSGKVPLCERNLQQSQLGRSQQFNCCTKNVGGDVNCPNNMCRPASGEKTSAACIDAFKAQCVNNGIGGLAMASAECKQFAMDNFADATVDNAVRNYCKVDPDTFPTLVGQPLGKRDPFCACINAGDESLCAPGDRNCFARLFPGIADSQALCMAPQCTQRPAGTFVPASRIEQCGNICLSQITAIDQSSISVRGSLNLITFCGDKISDDEIEKALQKTKMTRDEFDRYRRAQATGDVAEMDRITRAVQARLGVDPTENDNLPDFLEPKSSGLSQTAIIALATVGALLLAGALAGLIYWLVKMNQDNAKKSSSAKAFAKSRRNAENVLADDELIANADRFRRANQFYPQQQ
jgi:hypothetical protein